MLGLAVGERQMCAQCGNNICQFQDTRCFQTSLGQVCRSTAKTKDIIPLIHAALSQLQLKYQTMCKQADPLHCLSMHCYKQGTNTLSPLVSPRIIPELSTEVQCIGIVCLIMWPIELHLSSCPHAG